MKLHQALATAGVALAILTTLVGSAFSPVALVFAIWAAVPYGAVWLLGQWMTDRWTLGYAAAAALSADLGVRGSVFVWPRGSTAAVALVFSPIFITMLVLPAGVVGGLAFGRLWRSGAAGRVVAALVAPAALGLLALDLARPELFPTAVLARRALVERIGPPRTLVGTDAFEWMSIADDPGWRVIAQLDAEPGDELAIVDHDGADVFDSTSLSPEARVSFGASNQVWGPFSTLARLPDGRLAIVDAGGGYSRTLLKDLDGTTLWEYHPDPQLPPNVLRPADLDEDGVVELYASSSRFVARLDADGREQWRHPANSATLAALLPPDGATPSWVVGVEYGARVLVWDAGGRALAELPATTADAPLTAVDSFAGRVLVRGGASARGFDLEGRPRFEIPLGDFVLSQAAGVRLDPGEPPFLALVGATARFTERWRLLLVDPNRSVVYDEVLDRFPQILVARRGDGSDLLIVGDERGTRALRLRPRS